MNELLRWTEHLPTIDLAAGDVVVREGERTGAVYVLERGALSVTRERSAVAAITVPGALIGEVAALVGGDHTATVTAVVPSRLRVAEDGPAFLQSSPELTWHVAAEVARRLQGLIAYLADLKVQYAGIPGLDMVDQVLSRLTDRPGVAAEPGSDREPDPLY